MRICIDAGHGGHDPGAVGVTGLEEKRVANAIAGFLVDVLIESNVDVTTTRMIDEFISLQDRCDMANQWPADLFVSIHCNSAENRAASGYEIWTSPGLTNADSYASSVFKSFKEHFPSHKPRFDMCDGDVDKESKFKVLTGTMMPAILIEVEFISNAEGEEFLSKPSSHMMLAAVIAEGLLKK